MEWGWCECTDTFFAMTYVPTLLRLLRRLFMRLRTGGVMKWWVCPSLLSDEAVLLAANRGRRVMRGGGVLVLLLAQLTVRIFSGCRTTCPAVILPCRSATALVKACRDSGRGDVAANNGVFPMKGVDN
jgi:hypothetical protein